MIGEQWSTTKRNAAILAEPKGPTICCCGAPGGSAHNHMTGNVVLLPDFGCTWCLMGVHGNCHGRCTCNDRGHRRAR